MKLYCSYKRLVFEIDNDLFWEMKRPLSTNKRKETGIFRFFFRQFSKIWKIGERYKADKIGERANS